ncbi:MAG: hypothetical protein K2X99_09795 [Gemmatimonadaceae bacterium]|nr:hypothetical protein [Gemmatimonadaceae bacterium]
MRATPSTALACYESGATLGAAQYGVSQALQRRITVTPTFSLVERPMPGGAGRPADFATLLDDVLLGAPPRTNGPKWKALVTPR